MFNLEKINEISRKHGAVLLYNENLALYSSFKIGGACDALIRVNSAECLRDALLACKENNIPYFVLGKGSNVLISGEGLKGLVILIANDFSEIKPDGEFIDCTAGAALSNICRTARDLSLTGLEFAYGIPGTVGGAVYMNAGAYGGQMEDIVISCTYLDSGGELKEISGEELGFGYRRSFFTDSGKIIVGVRLQLKRGEMFRIDARMNELLKKRRDKQPLEFPSAGSTFKRPDGDYASRLIDACGLKGASCGGAEVSAKHAGFVVNKGGATFEDVMCVINMVKEKVKNETGVMLECEVEILK